MVADVSASLQADSLPDSPPGKLAARGVAASPQRGPDVNRSAPGQAAEARPQAGHDQPGRGNRTGRGVEACRDADRPQASPTQETLI
jgi:hypothetical protein